MTPPPRDTSADDAALGPPLALALVGLRDHAGAPIDFRSALELARRAQFRMVQLNAADRATRPRDLSRSARRDIAAAVRRAGLTVAGLDLFIPVNDFLNPHKADRAVAALADAARFATELAELAGDTPPVLSTALPTRRDAEAAGESPEAADRLASDLAAAADAAACTIADHAFPVDEQRAWGGPLAVGIDPAAVILAQGNPAKAVTAASDAGRLAAVRASDLTADGRVTPGDGKLDPIAYAGAVVTARFTGPGTQATVVDLRGISDAETAADHARNRFRF